MFPKFGFAMDALLPSGEQLPASRIVRFRGCNAWPRQTSGSSFSSVLPAAAHIFFVKLLEVAK
jgi:hypothetical protein